jgi:HK97 family phage portal protein
MVAKLPIKLYRKTADGAEEMANHPAGRLMTGTPSEIGTSFELRHQIQTGLGYGGNGYARVFRDRYFDPQEIYWLRPCDVRPECIKRPDGRRFVVYHINGESRPLNRDEIFHVRGPSLDGVCGMSRVRQLRESLGLSVSQREQAGKIAANGARIPGVLSTPAALKPDQLEAARVEVQRMYGGAENAGKMMILHGAWSYAAVNGMTMADAEFLDSRKFERTEICTLFRIPEVLLGNSDKASSWGTGIETLTNGFLTLTLDPILVNWEQSLNFTLLRTDEREAGYYFKFNRRALLAVLLESQANFFRTMRDIGAINNDEVRGLLELNKIPGGSGENFAQPFNGSGGTAARGSAPSAETKPQPASAA